MKTHNRPSYTLLYVILITQTCRGHNACTHNTNVNKCSCRSTYMYCLWWCCGQYFVYTSRFFYFTSLPSSVSFVFAVAPSVILLLRLAGSCNPSDVSILYRQFITSVVYGRWKLYTYRTTHTHIHTPKSDYVVLCWRRMKLYPLQRQQSNHTYNTVISITFILTITVRQLPRAIKILYKSTAIKIVPHEI